jgi:MFS family permease
VFSAYFLVQGVGQPLLGWLSDRIGRDAAMSICMAAGVLGYTLFVRGPGLVSVALATGLVGVGFAVPKRTTRWGENGDGRTADAVRSRVLFAEGTTRVTDVASGANGDVSIAGADYEGTNTRGWVRAIDIDGTVDWEWTADGDYRDSTRMPGLLSSG